MILTGKYCRRGQTSGKRYGTIATVTKGQTQNPIIVVDDDALTRKLLIRQLENAGYRVDAYGDGRAALQPICTMNSGIVIADWSMPEMDGLELCKALRELHEMQALGNVYFILLTAHSTKDKVIEGLAAGANDYLTKPYHQGELLARVQVGERMLRLQEELLSRNIEVQKVNAQMALLANRLEQLANTDPLTKLPNRRCVFEHLDEAWRVSERDGLPLSCIMIDIDRFKRVNDSFGHAAGDHVLIAVANAVRKHARRPELCGRFGGEEFLIVLPATPLADAVSVAEQARTSIAQQQVQIEERRIEVTVSVGVAERSLENATPDAMLSNADAMLYAAKENGRNQTWVCGPHGSWYPAGDAAAALVATHGAPTAGDAVGGISAAQPVQSAHADSDHE